MLNINQIQRLVQFEEYPRLIDRVLANGRCPSMQIQQQMAASEVAAPAGLGLALQRLAELTYGPTSQGQHMVDRLISLQRLDGSFGSGREPSTSSRIAATGTALAGLLRWIRQVCESGRSIDQRVTEAVSRAWIALTRLYGQRETVELHPMGWSIVAWQLGAFNEFRSMFPVQHLLERLDQALDQDTLSDFTRYARAAAA